MVCVLRKNLTASTWLHHWLVVRERYKNIGGSGTLVSNWWSVKSILGRKKLVGPEKWIDGSGIFVRLSCPHQLTKDFSADTIKVELRSLVLKCGGTISEYVNKLWVSKNISIISQIPQETIGSKQSETEKKPQTKIVDKEDMTQWPTLQDWQLVCVSDSMNSHVDTIKSVWEKGLSFIPTVNPFEILNSMSTQSGGWNTHAILLRIC